MLTTSSIDKKITSLLNRLNLQQKKAVLTIVKTFAQEQSGTLTDEDYEKEMNARFSEYERGEVKGYTVQETINDAKKAYKTKQKI